MIEVPFDAIDVGEEYFIEFRGEAYNKLKRYANNLRTPEERRIEVNRKFFAECTGKNNDFTELEHYPPGTYELLWQLKPGRVKNEDHQAFDIFQNMDRFLPFSNIVYYRPSDISMVESNNTDINTLIRSITGRDILSSVDVDENTKASDTGFYGLIPLHELESGKFYLIDVIRGDPEFINGKKNAIKMRNLRKEEKSKILKSDPNYALSGSIIAMYIEALDIRGNMVMPGSMIHKYKFCEIQNTNKILETRSAARNTRGFEYTDRYISGLDDRIDNNCILLSPMDFTVRKVDVAKMFEHMDQVDEEVAQNKRERRCTMSGGKRKNKSKRRKSKRRK